MALQRGVSIGTTAERPSDPQDGWLHYNLDTAALEIYSSAVWEPVNLGTATVTNVAISNRITYTGDGTNHRSVNHVMPLAPVFLMIVPRNTTSIVPLIAVNHQTTTPNIGVFTTMSGSVNFDVQTDPVTTFSFWGGDAELIRVGGSAAYNNNTQIYDMFVSTVLGPNG